MANGLTPPPPSEGRQRRNPRSGREDRSWGEAFMDPAGLEEFSKRRINPRLFAPRGGRRRNPGALYMGLRGLQEGIKWGLPTNPVDLALEAGVGGLGALGWRAARRLGPPLRRGLRGGWNRGVNLSRMLGRQAQRGMEHLQNYWPQQMTR